jgi:hypothetical protein
MRLHRSLLRSATVAAGATTTWNPSDKTAGMTLSGGNLTATGAGSGDCVRAIASASSGKKYWEITAGSPAVGDVIAGILNSSISVVGNYVVGFGSETAGVYFNSQIRVNGANVGSITDGFSVNSVISIALDLDNAKIWFRVDGSDWNNDVIANQNPATNTGGADISAVDLPVHAAISIESNTTYMTANFGATAYAYAPPSIDFGNW